MSLGERIKNQRSQSGLSQEKVAELVGVSRQAVTKWETGQSAPSTANLIALSEIFGVSLGELISGVRDTISDKNVPPVHEPAQKSSRVGRTVQLIAAIVLAIIGIMVVVIINNMTVFQIMNLTGVDILSANNVRTWISAAGAMAIFAGAVLFVLYLRGGKSNS
ncbi:MAG: helix-turn-helix domain-containing protein [Defluviitaleaceae bacterium]|nr:helix-turn-helix domain-containing protein [Defluviitaleaceae bacterium]